MPAQAAPGQPTAVPGTTVDQTEPRIQGGDTRLSVGEINDFWGRYYGRQARAGYRYNRQGQEESIAMPGAGDRGTRDAVRAAIDTARSNVADAREVIRGTSWAGRQFSHMTDIGDFARVLPILNIASRAVMHGLSGAQVNIPETEAYLSAFMPRPGDRQNTIENKLNHLDGILTRIQQRQGGQFSDEDVLALRNSMRGTLNLRPLTLDQHRGTGRTGGQPPPPPGDPTVPRDVPRRSSPPPSSGGGWRIERID